MNTGISKLLLYWQSREMRKRGFMLPLLECHGIREDEIAEREINICLYFTSLRQPLLVTVHNKSKNEDANIAISELCVHFRFDIRTREPAIELTRYAIKRLILIFSQNTITFPVFYAGAKLYGMLNVIGCCVNDLPKVIT